MLLLQLITLIIYVLLLLLLLSVYYTFRTKPLKTKINTYYVIYKINFGSHWERTVCSLERTIDQYRTLNRSLLSIKFVRNSQPKFRMQIC